MKKKLIISSLVAAFLIGCGGSDSSSSDSNSTKSGTFVDAPVQGLKYITSSGLSGVTNGNGTFKYKDGDAVTFKIGNVVLGSTKGESLVTPYNITNNPNKVKNIAYVLQSFDTDGNATDGVIKLPDEKLLNDYFTANSIDEVNVTDIKAKIKQKLKDVKFPNVNNTQAANNLNNYLKDKNLTDDFIQDALTNGLEALKNRSVYAGYIEDFSASRDFSMGGVSVETMIFNKDDSFVYEANNQREDGNKILKWGQNSLQEKNKDDETNTWTLLKIDVAKNLMFFSDGDGVYVVGASKDNVEKYVKESQKEFPREKIDAKELKGKYLYFTDNDSLETKAYKVTDDKFEYYDIDDEEAGINDKNYKHNSSKDKNIDYLDDGKLEYNNKENIVEKIPLAGKNVSASKLGYAFDETKVANILSDLGRSYIKFTKGNAYCLSDSKCFLDEDAMKDFYSSIMTINLTNANLKGKEKTPTHSKFSDYLKEKDYYNVDTELHYLDYEKAHIDDNKVIFNELETFNGTPWNSEMNLSDIDTATKILGEYDNGILVQMSHDGFSYKYFFYNNEDDAKAEYDKFKPIYKKYLNQN